MGRFGRSEGRLPRRPRAATVRRFCYEDRARTYVKVHLAPLLAMHVTDLHEKVFSIMPIEHRRNGEAAQRFCFAKCFIYINFFCIQVRRASVFWAAPSAVRAHGEWCALIVLSEPGAGQTSLGILLAGTRRELAAENVSCIKSMEGMRNTNSYGLHA